MCNCLMMPCKVCGTLLPLHLGDWLTQPEEVECYCRSHLPKGNVTVFILTKSEKYPIYKIGWKMGIRYLTENAKQNRSRNYPNLGVDWTTEER